MMFATITAVPRYKHAKPNTAENFWNGEKMSIFRKFSNGTYCQEVSWPHIGQVGLIITIARAHIANEINLGHFFIFTQERL